MEADEALSIHRRGAAQSWISRWLAGRAAIVVLWQGDAKGVLEQWEMVRSIGSYTIR